jgi:hypothetical protein
MCFVTSVHLFSLKLPRRGDLYSRVRCSLLRRLSRIHPSRRRSVTCRNRLFFYWEELLAPRSAPKPVITIRRLSATAYSIYSQLPSSRQLHPQPEDAPFEWWQGTHWNWVMKIGVSTGHRDTYNISTECCVCIRIHGRRWIFLRPFPENLT